MSPFSECSTVKSSILVNHLGFRPDDPFKRALRPVGAETGNFLGGGLGRLIRVSDFIRYPLNTPGAQAASHDLAPAIEDTPLGRYAVYDMSGLTERGGYQLVTEHGLSEPFLIYRDAWKRCFRLLLEWYRIAACGEAVPGYHEACHLDDCRLVTTGAHVDLVGGWHDAGDLRKWTSTMALVTQRLGDFIEEHGDHLAGTGVDEDLVWRQLERGATYLLKTVDPVTGLVWHNVASEGDNSCNIWTDNQPGTADDRRVEPTVILNTQHAYIQAQSTAARILARRRPELAARALASAQAVWQRLPAPGERRDHLASAIELWRATGDTAFRDIARADLRALLDTQCTAARFGQDEVRGFLMDGDALAFNDGFRGRGGRNVLAHLNVVGQLARALLLWSDDRDATRWRDGLTLLLEGFVAPLLRRSPYRVLPVCVYARGTGPTNGRSLAGDLCYRHFGVEAEGDNAGLLDSAAALGLAARALRQPQWAAYGQKHVEWVLGFNPFGASMLTGLGYNHPCPFSFYVGQIPGGIVNGIKGDAHDNPRLTMHREMEPMFAEYWSINTAAMLRALAILENEPLC